MKECQQVRLAVEPIARLSCNTRGFERLAQQGASRPLAEPDGVR